MPGPPVPYRPSRHDTYLTDTPTDTLPVKTVRSLSANQPSATIRQAFTGNSPSVERYEKLNRVGEGTYGIVYRARDKASGTIVALKRIRMEQEQEGLPLSSLREISLLKSLRHENVVSVLDVVVGNGLDNIFMVMEYCEQDMGNLMDNVISKGAHPGYREAEVKCLMSQLLTGLAYLHDNYIIHRDLKLSNLLLTSSGILKIADFGLARKFGTPVRPMTPRVVTLWYRAPELLFGEKSYTTAIDMWAVGCIFGELIRARPLLPGKVEQQQLDLICRLLGTPNARIWPGFDKLPYAKSVKLPSIPYDDIAGQFSEQKESVRKLLKSLLTYYPPSRLTVHEALRHDYFRESPPPCAPVLLPTYPELRTEEFARIPRHNDRKRPRVEDRDVSRVRRSRGQLDPSILSRAREEEEELELGVPAYQQFRFS
ncbi:hypothetical protein SpCBS45565_g07747 [Spizellomyces sp. 'palustris']|nr:hypothetical protein SpCBS45565_g07747 [Spizellomyces sp. 'palustris']